MFSKTNVLSHVRSLKFHVDFMLHLVQQPEEETSILQRQSQLQRIGISSQPESVLRNQCSRMAMPSGDILTAEGHATAGAHADLFHIARTQIRVLHSQCHNAILNCKAYAVL